MDLPRPIKISIFATLICWGLYVLLQLSMNRNAVIISDNENYRAKDSTYDVWEYDFISAKDYSGKKFRVAVVNDRKYTNPDYELTGNDGLGDQEAEQIPLGSEKELEFSRFEFRSMHGGQQNVEPITWQQSVRVRVKHVRSCVVQMSESQETKIRNKSYGMWTLPQMKKETVRKFSPPPCAELPDSQIELATSEAAVQSPEVIAAKLEDEKVQVRKRLEAARDARAKKIVDEFRKEARELNPAKTTDLLPPTASSVLKDLCTNHAPLMRVLKIKEIVAERTERSRQEHDGYTSIQYNSNIKFVHEDGKIVESDIYEAQDLALVLKSIKIDDRACLSLTAAPSGQSDSRSLEKANKSLKIAFDRYMRNIAHAQAESDIPMPN